MKIVKSYTYMHCLSILLIENTANLIIWLDLLIQIVNTSLGDRSSLMRLQETTEIGEDHAVAGGQVLGRHHVVRIYRDGHGTRSIRGALCISIAKKHTNLLQLRIIIEKVLTLMQSQNGIIVEIQELMGGDIELILHRLVDEGSQISLMGFTVGNYVNRNSLQHEKVKRN